ncbi:hypothetical protein CXF95_02300 [Paraglaciecola sp. MB-3u-78]|jgi:hypothetical protein|nr:hypothetical protein CXF95_02300 [Paraglaciecola sp. MB-3u-78]
MDIAFINGELYIRPIWGVVVLLFSVVYAYGNTKLITMRQKEEKRKVILYSIVKALLKAFDVFF